MDASRVGRLDALTSLRFVAAAMIVAHHSQGYFEMPFGWVAPYPLEHGVSFFFVLSGFILASVYPALSWQAAPRKEGTYRLRQQLELDQDLGLVGGSLHETPVVVSERRATGRDRSP